MALDGIRQTVTHLFADLLDKMEVQDRGDVSEEIDFIIGKSIDILKGTQAGVSHTENYGRADEQSNPSDGSGV